MFPFNAIAAMSENRVIGRGNRIPWHLPEEYRWFKRRTMGGTLVMGRKTFESIGDALPGRKTIVVTRTPRIVEDVEISTTLEPIIARAAAESQHPYWVCGGTEIYRQLLPHCRRLYLTRVKRTVEGDAVFPPFEDLFDADQVIHENDEFRVERWRRKGESAGEPEPWPL